MASNTTANGFQWVLTIYALLFIPLAMQFLYWVIFQSGYRDLGVLIQFVYVAVKAYTWDVVSPYIFRCFAAADSLVVMMIPGEAAKTKYKNARDYTMNAVATQAARGWDKITRFWRAEVWEFVNSINMFFAPVTKAWREINDEFDDINNGGSRPVVKDEIQRTYYENRRQAAAQQRLAGAGTGAGAVPGGQPPARPMYD